MMMDHSVQFKAKDDKSVSVVLLLYHQFIRSVWSIPLLTQRRLWHGGVYQMIIMGF